MIDTILLKLNEIYQFVVNNPVYVLLSFVSIYSALMVVSLRNIFHCALFLILCLFSVAGIYILLEAEFLAAVQILIYVGAVSILMIFAIMLTSRLATKQRMQSNDNVTVAVFICAGFLLTSLGSFGYTVWKVVENPVLPENNTLTIGKLLMTDYVLPFEVVSIVLLAAMIGAIVLARREKI